METKTTTGIWSQVKQKKISYLFIAPFFVLFFILMIIPIFYSLYLSFHRAGMGQAPRFIGLFNYISLFTDAKFLNSLFVTIKYVVFQVSIMIVLAVISALLVNLPWLKLKNFFRLCFFAPIITSLVVAAAIFSLIFGQDIGILNKFLEQFGLPTYNWLLDPKLALYSLITIGVWRWTGYFMIIILAGRQSISTELYDAAKIDGASEFQITTHITLPLLFPVIFVAIIMGVIYALQLFVEPYVLTQGGPSDSTLSLALYQFNTSFYYLNFGYGSAIAYALIILIGIVTILQFKLYGQKAGMF